MREIGIILIIDFSFPEEETSWAQHLSLALYSSFKAESNQIQGGMEISSIPWYVKSCDKYEVLHFHPLLGFEDAHCAEPNYHATHLQHAARVQDPVWHRIQEAVVDPDRLDQGGQLWHGAQLPGAGRLCAVQGKDEGPQRALHSEPGVGQWGWSWLRRDQRVRGPLWAAGS